MIFKNAQAVIGGEVKKVDIRTENGLIAEIGENLSGGEVLDCAGLVDIHVHPRERGF